MEKIRVPSTGHFEKTLINHNACIVNGLSVAGGTDETEEDFEQQTAVETNDGAATSQNVSHRGSTFKWKSNRIEQTTSK